MSVRVFEGLAAHSEPLVETIMKAPAEFWRIWTLFYDALVEFSESNPVFESAIHLFRTLGAAMLSSDPVLTQQLMVDVGIPSLGPLLVEAPGKREALCELIYTYAQPSVQGRLSALRSLKERVDNIRVYVACLSSFAPLEVKDGLMDDNLLDMYMYYALVALQSPQPRIRVAGLAILVTITESSGAHSQSVLGQFASFSQLVHDSWWEVQAQLLLLASKLLQRAVDCQRPASEDEAGAPALIDDEAVESLLLLISRLFNTSHASKNVLQVGLCALAPCMHTYPSLIPNYVAAILVQPAVLRRRLFSPPPPVPTEEEDNIRTSQRLAYVMGTSSRLYEEFDISSHWPAVSIARALADQMEEEQLPRLDLEHLEVFAAALPMPHADLDPEWLPVFEKMVTYIFLALVDPDLHNAATVVVRRFWLCRPQSTALAALEASKETLLQCLVLLYCEMDERRVDEAEMLAFLREMVEAGGAVADAVREAVHMFQERHHVEFKRSRLDTLFQ